MGRTGISIEMIEELLRINQHILNHLVELILDTKCEYEINTLRFYRGGILEERLRLMFRIPEGVKNVDLDSIEIRDERGLVALIEFKRGLKFQEKLASYGESKAMSELGRAAKIPQFILTFNDELTKFQIFEIGKKPDYSIKTLDEVWEWRKLL